MATLVQTPPERPSLHHRDRLWGLHTLDMADSNADHRPVESDSRLDSPARNSPASAVCYLDMSEAHPHSAQNITSRDCESSSTGDHDFESPEGDSTPRSEVPSVPSVQSLQSLPATYKTSILQQQPQGLDAEPDYFSPQPLRLYSSNIAQSTPASTDPSPTISVNASTTSIDRPESVPTDNRIGQSSAATAHLDRPLFPPRDLSSASTASVATVRANSVDPILHTPPSRSIRDGPVYPNQSYAALQYQQYPSVHMPPILRSRSSHPAHFSGHSISGLSSFGFNADFPFHRDIMESGSRTVGNSPASSPGLFDPTASAARRVKQPIDFSHTYSTPWLHHTHRQAPKETHIADVDVDPVSGRKLVNQYEFIDELGRGVHGKVKLGRNLKDGNFVAIKIVDRYSKRRRLGKNTSHEDKIKREIAILKKARHPNIVSLLEVIDDPAKKKVYIVLEHVELGEVKWRTEGAKEICLVEWRRFKRESEGIFDNESAVLEDEKILKLAHQKLERQHRKTKEAQQQRSTTNENEPWSFEHGGESEDEYSEAGRSSRASVHGEERSSSHIHFVEQQTDTCGHEDNMETAFRSATPTTHTRHEDQNIITELEGTMYGAYDTELYRGRTPSVTGSNSSHITDGDEEVPEHFRYVPLMTIQGAREAFRDTVLGLEYLHYQGVIHRDIKPANLLQTKEHRIKISDFGVSYLGRPTSNESTGEQSESDMQDIDEALELAKTVGTPAFYAPELCRTETDIDTPRIDGKIDVWALGVTLYCLIYGRVPFHDHNTFVLMRLISETEPYIPTYRLKAVAERTTSRPNSHGRSYQQMTTAKRAPHDLDFEEVDVHLRDLLQRLLTKDPQQRISIKEIKRHPWLAQDIDNFNSWVEETDPGRSALGRKIEVSRDDVEKAVIPINFIDRVRSGVKKTYDTVTKALTRGASRRRAQSSATDLDGQASISAHSSSSTISQEGRRSSLAPPGASLLEALSRSRESEHPLSQSISANHEGKDRLRYLERTNSRTTSPAHSVEGHDQATALPSLFRPQPPERSYSTISSAASVRTVRQTDMQGRGRAVSPIVPSALPGTPTALESPGGSNLGGLFGGMTRTVVNKMRSRELLKPSKEHSHLRTKSIDRLVGGDDDAHGAPSLAISPTVVAGQVDQPNVLQNLSPSVARGVSPSYKDLQSSDPTERASSRQSSVSSMSSRLHRTWATQHELETGPTLDMPPKISRETSEDRFSRAKDEFVRRRVREETFNRERIPSATRSRPSSAVVPAVCPPSPDDDAFYRRQKIEDYLYHQQTSSDTSPVSHPINIQTGPRRVLTSSSSEDQFTPMSQSTSNPSIPSVASANSSAPDDYMQMKQSVGIVSTASADSMHFNQFDAPIDDPAGYDGDHAIESEEDEESDEEDFIVMGKKKRPTDAPRSESIANGELARSSIRKELTSRRRSARSGSGGTVKKIPPPGVNGDEKNSEPVVH